MSSFLSPVSAVEEGKQGTRKIRLDKLMKLRVFGCTHEEDFRGLENADLGERFGVGLAIAYLA
jgi:hypothetical protein